MKIPREMRSLVDEYRALGWTIEHTRKHRIRWKSPTGRVVISSSSPSDGRAFKNHEATLRRVERGY